MSIAYKKLKSQLKQETRDGKKGWFFSITEEQEFKFIFPIFFEGRSKRKVLDILKDIVYTDEEFFKEFGI